MLLRPALPLSVVLVVLLAACATPLPPAPPPPTAATQPADRYAAVVAAPDRSAADRTNDERRHPADLLGFIGVQPGITALDLSTGGGYTTELLARAIGPGGTVYAQARPPATPAPQPAQPEGGMAAPAAAPAPMAAPRRTAQEQVEARIAHLQQAGVPAARIEFVARPFEDPIPATVADGGLDLATLMFNYHDLGFMGVDRAALNRAVFRALKPGGLYVIADHAGRPGTGISESGTLHRIEEAFLQREVEAAGFRLLREGMFLRNPADPRDRNMPEPPQPKDEFVLAFVKP